MHVELLLFLIDEIIEFMTLIGTTFSYTVPAHFKKIWVYVCEVAAQSLTKIANGTLAKQMNRCEPATTLFCHYELEYKSEEQQQNQQVHLMNSECGLGFVYEFCVLASKLRSNWFHFHIFTLHAPHWWLSYCHVHCIEWANFLLCTSENVKTIELSCNICNKMKVRKEHLYLTST